MNTEAQTHDAEGEAAHEVSELSHPPVKVELQRSVRYGRLLLVGAALGAIVGMVASVLFPVAADANYELGQVAGLMAVVGAAVGLACGAILALVLGKIAARSRGAAMAVQTDVR